jgi:hypothetical protein
MAINVLCGLPQQNGAISERGDTAVTCRAEQCSYTLGVVAVIDR